MNFKIHTFGCKVNSYDSGLIATRMTNNGYKSSREESLADIHILNTCAVTAEASRKAVHLAKNLKREDENRLVVVTGCAAQVDTALFEGESAVDLIVANSHKAQLQNILKQYLSLQSEERVWKGDIFSKEDLEPGGGEDLEHTRSFLKIQDGCDSFCTFCVIPFARGKSRSIPIRDLVNRIRELSAHGVEEVVLTGVHIGDYQDGERRLEDLMEAILKETPLPRLRLSSLEPIELSPRLLELYADERLCRHFHMSIQSAESETLKNMKRKYRARDVEQALKDIETKVPGAFVGMDVIAGFPGESEAAFEETFQRLKDLPWSRIHVFPYSPRPKTFAARRSDQLPREVIKARTRALSCLSLERHRKAAAEQILKTKKLLPLNRRQGRLRLGLSRDFWPIWFEDEKDSGERELEVTVTAASPKGSQMTLLGLLTQSRTHAIRTP